MHALGLSLKFTRSQPSGSQPNLCYKLPKNLFLPIILRILLYRISYVAISINDAFLVHLNFNDNDLGCVAPVWLSSDGVAEVEALTEVLLAICYLLLRYVETYLGKS